MNQTRKYWWYQPGTKNKKTRHPCRWEDFKANSIIAIDSEGMGDLRQYSSYEEIEKWFKQNGIVGPSGKPQKWNIQCNNDFIRNMNPDDVILIKNGTTTCIGCGIIRSNYKFNEKCEINGYDNRFYDSYRDVEWIACHEDNPWNINNHKHHISQRKTLTNISDKLALIKEINERYPIEEMTNLQLYPEQINDTIEYTEGAKKQITVNSYERNAQARFQCIKKYGYKCMACGIDFEQVYGEIGKNFIHVHHIKPLSDINSNYVVDPLNDMVPVCPNCHAMLHKKNPPLSIESLKSLLNEKTINKA